MSSNRSTQSEVYTGIKKYSQLAFNKLVMIFINIPMISTGPGASTPWFTYTIMLKIVEMEKEFGRILQRVAFNTRNLRKMQNLTQEDMTEHGFELRHYQRIESGKYSMSLHSIVRLASVFNVDVSEFFKKKQSKKKTAK